MHFDEVYHARTATEFLQDWRYGIVARHLRVDPPAPRQVRDGRRASCLWGEDDVSATSELGVPGPRRGRRAAPRRRRRRRGDRAGERLHVATGSEIRTYDLRTRALDRRRSRRPGPARSPSMTSGEPARRRLRRRAHRDARPERDRRRRRRPSALAAGRPLGDASITRSTTCSSRTTAPRSWPRRRERLDASSTSPTGTVVGVARPRRDRRPGARRQRVGAASRPSPRSTDPAAAAVDPGRASSAATRPTTRPA